MRSLGLGILQYWGCCARAGTVPPFLVRPPPVLDRSRGRAAPQASSLRQKTRFLPQPVVSNLFEQVGRKACAKNDFPVKKFEISFVT